MTTPSTQSLTEEEQKVFRLYGKLPNKKDLLQNKFKERKYFDSGDYALSKAGKNSDNIGGVSAIGSQHPLPENIPHLNSSTSNGGNVGSNGSGGNGGNGTNAGGGGSPVKEATSFLNRETSIDDVDGSEKEKAQQAVQSVS